MEHAEVGTGCINSRRLPKGKTFIPPRAMYLPMRAALCLLMLLLLAGGAAAAETNRYSYLAVDRVAINLSGPEATVVADYRIDPGIRPLVAIFGRGDLHQKVRRVLGFEDARVVELSLDRAVLVVDNASMDYGEGSYWFPAHAFGVVVPSLTVPSPQKTRQSSPTHPFPRLLRHLGAAARPATA
jgi:hypothetical protein